jgi:ankyrin repeat protein
MMLGVVFAFALAVLRPAMAADDWLKTEIHRAAWYGLMPELMAEIEKGVDVNVQDDLGRTPLHFAAYKGRISTTPVEDRKPGEPDPGNYKTAEMVEALLEAGADVNILDNDGSNALMESVPNGNADIVQLLLNAGAKRDVENRHGDTALSEAQRRKHVAIEELLLKDEL